MAAPLFFANGAVSNDAIKKAVVAAPGGAGAVKHFVVDLVAVTDVDVTGADSLAVLKAWLRTNEVELSFSRVRPGARARFERLGLITTEQVFATNRAAVAALSG